MSVLKLFVNKRKGTKIGNSALFGDLYDVDSSFNPVPTVFAKDIHQKDERGTIDVENQKTRLLWNKKTISARKRLQSRNLARTWK